MFFEYPPIKVVRTDASPLADVVNHCASWRNFVDGRSRITDCHECTHGANSELRNATPANDAGFYLLDNQAVRILEPATRKSDCIRFIPPEMRYGRFNLYIRGQKDWESSPLYVFDEWTAYRNGAVEMLAIEGKNEGDGADYLFGPIEFAVYGIATAMAAQSDDVTAFTKWMLADVFNLYNRGKARFPWGDAAKCYDQIRTSAPMRTFLGSDFRFPEESIDAPDVRYVP